MGTVSDEIFKALGYLLIAGVVSFAWKTARDNTRGGSWKEVLWKGFLWCAGIALFTSFTLGSPSCEERTDPVFGGCEYYADDGYEPTTDQRVANFAYFMTLLYIPVVLGVYYGNKEKTVI
ncbi:MAG: hypothetical protein UY22_C0043G0008 [Candidatus Amesbacteria bacterium GW2011_GWC1_48_10]|uniref:Uncharacterized protein n=2 Tax=Patescibacteria group TaxID=1783273 RepID=A0A0G1UBA0_9BACT|nr:MAG: hypothetical protein UY22_C0043G0008 [Candidatus Amesbacteria bacterium GW2011_GWC1_48_10]KKW22755.1 MAG: hypothetical protein UY67_C0036G0005 [Candidatus Kaiserbacteria bacterium GW2011_GWA2_52_12]